MSGEFQNIERTKTWTWLAWKEHVWTIRQRITREKRPGENLAIVIQRWFKDRNGNVDMCCTLTGYKDLLYKAPHR